MVRLKVPCQTSFLRSLKGRVRINPLTRRNPHVAAALRDVVDVAGSLQFCLFPLFHFFSVFPLIHFFGCCCCCWWQPCRSEQRCCPQGFALDFRFEFSPISFSLAWKLLVFTAQLLENDLNPTIKRSDVPPRLKRVEFLVSLKMESFAKKINPHGKCRTGKHPNEYRIMQIYTFIFVYTI